MSPAPTHEVDWVLVERLRQRGWERAEAGPRQDGTGMPWRGFREGAPGEAGSSEILWIAAADEATAMRLLLTELRAREAHGSRSAADVRQHRAP